MTPPHKRAYMKQNIVIKRFMKLRLALSRRGLGREILKQEIIAGPSSSA
jgi:hypothetical protein